MRLVQSIILISIITLIGIGCSAIKPGKTSSKDEGYSEDLSTYRPEKRIAEEPVIIDSEVSEIVADSTTEDITVKLNIELDTAAVYSRSTIKYIDGFTIQVYGGDNRNLAKEERLDLIRHFPDTKPMMVFEQPNYKVRVGQFYTRLEAQHLYSQVKHYFRGAILIPKRIYIE